MSSKNPDKISEEADDFDYKGVTIPARLKLNTKLYSEDSIEPQDAELFLNYNQATGRFKANPAKFLKDHKDWGEQTYSPVSVLIMQGRTKEAVALAEVELAENPNSYKAINSLSVAQSSNGDYLASLNTIDDAIEKAIEENKTKGLPAQLTKDQAFLYQNAAITMATLGSYDDAITSISKRIEIDPDKVYPHALKAEFLMKNGQSLEAMKEYETALTMDSDFKLADQHKQMIAKELGFDTVQDALDHVRKEQVLLRHPRQELPNADPFLSAGPNIA